MRSVQCQLIAFGILGQEGEIISVCQMKGADRCFLDGVSMLLKVHDKIKKKIKDNEEENDRENAALK